jgi:hypothetical protein
VRNRADLAIDRPATHPRPAPAGDLAVAAPGPSDFAAASASASEIIGDAPLPLGTS